MLADPVLSHQGARAMGVEHLTGLAAEYVANGMHFEGAKIKYSLAVLCPADHAFSRPILKESLGLLEQDGLETQESLQLQWDVLGRYKWLLGLSEPNGEEDVRVAALIKKTGENDSLYKDPIALWATYGVDMAYTTGLFAFAFNDGRIVTDSDIHDHQLWARDVGIPLLTQACDQS